MKDFQVGQHITAPLKVASINGDLVEFVPEGLTDVRSRLALPIEQAQQWVGKGMTTGERERL